MRILLAGNPNSGKTTLFNSLTGKLEYVGNWSGVTVDIKEVKAKKRYGPVTIVDLPGTYSISPYSAEEAITAEQVNSAKADVIINIIDITNLARSLFFTTQLLELNTPMIVALNKADILLDKIDTGALSKALGCEVITISAGKNQNLDELIRAATQAKKANNVLHFDSDDERFAHIDRVLATAYLKKFDRSKRTTADKIDKVLTSKLLGLPIFIGVLWFVFYISQTWLGTLGADLLGAYILDPFGSLVDGLLVSGGTNELLHAFVMEGLIGGIGAVLGFVPLIMALFFLLALLEDCGYMSRVAVVMDIFFKKIGLSGKAIIPMVVGIGCAIPGVMATRAIENENERRRLCILAPFIPCGAKAPVIALFAAAFFADSTWVAPLVYIFSIAVIFVVGLVLKKIFTLGSENSIFIIELPKYKIPRLTYALRHMLDKGWAFIKKAATIILICNTAIWFLQTYDFGLNVVTNADTSMLAALAGSLTWLFVPLGFAAWQLVAGAVTGFIAKENVVGTLAVVLIASESALHSASGPLASVTGLTAVTALGYMLFNLFTPPCFAALGAMNSEMRSKKWLAIGIGVQLGTGYIIALLVNLIGTPLTGGTLSVPTIASSIFILVAAIAWTLYLMKKGSKHRVETLVRS